MSVRARLDFDKFKPLPFTEPPVEDFNDEEDGNDSGDGREVTTTNPRTAVADDMESTPQNQNHDSFVTEGKTHDFARMTTDNPGDVAIILTQASPSPSRLATPQSPKALSATWYPVSLAPLSPRYDLDDASSDGGSSISLIHIEDKSRDLAWSLLSNSLFLIGGTCYVILSAWDIIQPREATKHTFWQHVGYVTISWIGPLVYLVNSVIDIYWAKDLRRTEKRRKRQFGTSRKPPPTPTQQQNQSVPAVVIEGDFKATLERRPSRVSVGTSFVREKIRSVRKYAAHRRGLLAAASFGLAAFFAVVDMGVQTFGNYDHWMMQSTDTGLFDFLSIHWYVMSAFFAVCGQRTRPRICTWCFLTDPDNLEDLGDMFFLVGSLFDAVLCDMSFDNNSDGFWDSVSSALWFFDACFYLRSDFCTAAVLKELLAPLEAPLVTADDESTCRRMGCSLCFRPCCASRKPRVEPTAGETNPANSLDVVVDRSIEMGLL